MGSVSVDTVISLLKKRLKVTFDSKADGRVAFRGAKRRRSRSERVHSGSLVFTAMLLFNRMLSVSGGVARETR